MAYLYPVLTTLKGVRVPNKIFVEFKLLGLDEPTRVSFELRSAFVSELWEETIRGYINSNGKKRPLVLNGQVILYANTPLSRLVLSKFQAYCDYHSFDKDFQYETPIEDLEKDHYDLEQKRQQEGANFWDWDFICSIGCGLKMNENGRAKFYDLMLLAHELKISSLIDLGSKYLCRQIDFQDLYFTTDLLGLPRQHRPPPPRDQAESSRDKESKKKSSPKKSSKSPKKSSKSPKNNK